MYPYIIQGSNITVVVDNMSYTLSEGQIGYSKLKKAIIKKNWDAIPGLVSPVKIISTYVDGMMEIKNGELYYVGKKLHGSLAKRVISMFEEGFDIKPMTRFIQNLNDNPSNRAVQELYGFLEVCNLPITEYGNFLAYKRVGDDYMDMHSHSVLNKPADLMTAEEKSSVKNKEFGSKGEVFVDIFDGKTTVSMERNRVDDVADNTCSHGLHFCSFEYLKSFPGSRIVILEINPADVVSIPTDYNFTEGRCSEYRVIGEVDKSKFSENTLETGASVYDYEYDEEHDEEHDEIDEEQELHDDMYQRLDSAKYANLVAIAEELGHEVTSGETDVDLIDAILDEYEIEEIEEVISMLGNDV